MRYAAAQLLAYVEDRLYLRLAAKANAVAAIGDRIVAVSNLMIP